MLALTPELLLSAYSIGLFPMANDRLDPTVNWIEPRIRGVIPLDKFRVPRRLRKRIRQKPYKVTVDRDFRGVIEACASATIDRPRTWLNDELIEIYVKLHAGGHAHAVECWRDRELIGGLYGVSLGSAFFGESMFSREVDSSKIALVELFYRLKIGGYTLLDTQFTTPHLKQFGAVDINRVDYRRKLRRALNKQARMPKTPYSLAVSALSGDSPGMASTQSSTQTS